MTNWTEYQPKETGLPPIDNGSSVTVDSHHLQVKPMREGEWRDFENYSCNPPIWERRNLYRFRLRDTLDKAIARQKRAMARIFKAASD